MTNGHNHMDTRFIAIENLRSLGNRTPTDGQIQKELERMATQNEMALRELFAGNRKLR